MKKLCLKLFFSLKVIPWRDFIFTFLILFKNLPSIIFYSNFSIHNFSTQHQSTLRSLEQCVEKIILAFSTFIVGHQPWKLFSRCFLVSKIFSLNKLFFVTFGCCFLLALLSIFHLFVSFLPKVPSSDVHSNNERCYPVT